MMTKSETTLERILAAARALFLERNYADVSMSRIASVAEVTKGALYHHFSSKEELYLEMLHSDLRKKLELFVEAASAPGSCRERLGRLTLAFLTLPPEQRNVMRLVRRDINIFRGQARADLIKAYQRTLPEPIEEILREGCERGELSTIDPRLLAWNFVAQVEVALTPFADTLFEDLDSKLACVLELFFHGAAQPTDGATA